MIAPLAPISPSISFPESIKICLKGYGNFNGRGRRSEFWWFYLLCIIINAVLIGIIFAFITSKNTTFSVCNSPISRI